MIKIILKQIKQFIKEGIVWSVLWTIFLTPYSIFMVRLSIEQYLYWVSMEFIIVLPLSPIISRIVKYILEKI